MLDTLVCISTHILLNDSFFLKNKSKIKYFSKFKN